MAVGNEVLGGHTAHYKFTGSQIGVEFMHARKICSMKICGMLFPNFAIAFFACVLLDECRCYTEYMLCRAKNLQMTQRDQLQPRSQLNQR